MELHELRLRVISPLMDTDDPASTRALAGALAQAGLAVTHKATPAPFGTKGEGMVLALVLKAADAVIGKVVEVAAALFTRPGAPPVEIEIEAEDGKARIKFDPRTLKPEQIPALLEALSQARPRL